MDITTCILRFRDLITDDGGTIARHRESISKNRCKFKFVWWGWWKKQQEKLPKEFLNLASIAHKSELIIYLVDSGQKKLYTAICHDIVVSDTDTVAAPDSGKYTPKYYNKKKYYAWFKFSDITEIDPSKIQELTNIESSSLFIDETANYSKFNGKRICSLDELIQQNRTVWFVRPFQNGDGTEEIILLNSSYVQPTHYSEKYFQVNGDTLLWLSDLHLADNVFKNDGKIQDNSLADHIRDHISQRNIAGLLISGDITSRGNEEGFSAAKRLLFDINSTAVKEPLEAKNIIICPGNHDFKREELYLSCPALMEALHATTKTAPNDACNPLFAIDHHMLYDRSNCEGYSKFYENIYKIKPNEYFSCGKKLLLSSGHAVEILALNSVRLQQFKDFEGHGYVSTEQLKHAEKAMHWDKPCPHNVIRIAMMHHHFLPTCFNEDIEASRSNNAAIFDADEVMRWLVTHDVKILLHGHKHRRKISRLLYPIDNEADKVSSNDFKLITIIGMGGTAAPGADNLLALIRFETSKMIVEYYRMRPDKIAPDKPEQTIEIPIE